MSRQGYNVLLFMTRIKIFWRQQQQQIIMLIITTTANVTDTHTLMGYNKINELNRNIVFNAIGCLLHS